MRISEASKELIAAIQKEDKVKLIASIKEGADINSAIWLKKTHSKNIVSKEKLNVIHYAVHKNWLKGIKELCKNPNLELNKKNSEGYTPLHIALINEENEIARILIKAGANPNVKSNKGNTPLHTAVARNSSDKMITALLNNKADINIFNAANETPLDRAITNQQWNFAILLLNHASEHEIPCSINRTSQIAFSNYLKENKFNDLLEQLESIKNPTKQKAQFQYRPGNAFIGTKKKEKSSQNNPILGKEEYPRRDYSDIFTRGAHFWDPSDEEENSQEDHSTPSGSKIEEVAFEETSSHLADAVNTKPFEIEQETIDNHHTTTQEDNTKTCGCCFGEISRIILTCNNEAEPHYFCHQCIQQEINRHIISRKTQLKCINIGGCTGVIIDDQQGFLYDRCTTAKKAGTQETNEADIQKNEAAIQEIIVSLNKGMNKLISIEQSKQIKTAGIEGLEGCPFCDNQMIIDAPLDEIPDFPCDNCQTVSCRQCKQISHPGTVCPEIKHKAERQVEEVMSEEVIRECPNCALPIVKDEGCNKITCLCGNIMCNICKKDITIEKYNHFSPNTCPLFDDFTNGNFYEAAVNNARNEAINRLRAENPGLREEDLNIPEEVNHPTRENDDFYNDAIIPDHQAEEFNDNYFDNQQPLYPDDNYFDDYNLIPNNYYPRDINRVEHPAALHFFNAAINDVNIAVHGIEGLNLEENRIPALPVGGFRRPIRAVRHPYQAANPRRRYRH